MTSLAYSYIRFSNVEQASGNSLERQLELAKAYAQRKGLTLDDKLTMRDLGVSAFTGKNLTQGALGVFLKAVTEGKIPTGSFLLIEDVDRLSRLPVMDALDVFRTIINAGITVVTLKDGKEYSAAQLQGNWTELMPVLVSMGRGFEESETKSRRIRDGWAKSKEDSRTQLKPHGANCPSWLTFVPATKGTAAHYVPIEEHVATVKIIFDLSIAGNGMLAIANKLRELDLKPFKGRGIGIWSASSLQKLLTNRALLGEYQPYDYPEFAEQRKQNGKAQPVKAGSPIKGYYPVVLDELTFHKASEALTSRRIHRTTRQPKDYNVWHGVIKCKLCGSSLHLAKRQHRYFICYKSRLGQCEGKYVRFDVAEEYVREVLVKIDSMSLVGRSDAEFERTLSQAKITQGNHQRDVDFYTDMMRNPDTRSVATATLLADSERAVRVAERHIENLNQQVAKELIIDRDEFFSRLDLVTPEGRHNANALLKQLKIQALVDRTKFHIVQDGIPLFDVEKNNRDQPHIIPHTEEMMKRIQIQDVPDLDTVLNFYRKQRGEPIVVHTPDPNYRAPNIEQYDPGYFDLPD